jgi:hypothetical protein
MDPTQIYLNKMVEASKRLAHCQLSLNAFTQTQNIFDFESSVLQLRKVMECLAMAAIAPNHKEYETFRKNAEKSADYRKDFNGKAIVKMLEKVNPDFYPIPLHPPTTKNGHHQITPLRSGFLKKQAYETTYDRLGKFLHSDNPWGDDKGVLNLAKSIPEITSKVIRLLALHSTFIHTPRSSRVWIVEVNFNTHAARIAVGEAPGDFQVDLPNA